MDLYIYVEMREKKSDIKLKDFFVFQNLLDMVDFSEAKKMSVFFVDVFGYAHNFRQISGPYSCAACHKLFQGLKGLQVDQPISAFLKMMKSPDFFSHVR